MVQAESPGRRGSKTIATTLASHKKTSCRASAAGSYLIEMGLSDTTRKWSAKAGKSWKKNQNKISSLVMDMLTFSKETRSRT